MTAQQEDIVAGYTLRSVEIERDAEALAAMWNASDDQWPGTWTAGVPMTAERVRDWFAREQHIDVMIWENGEAIAAYCSLWKRHSEPKAAYIALLNVAPAFQKLGLARRLLTQYVERTVALGFARLDLGTWSGNLKAVPLYKKCGFCWVPGTSVDMENYLPAILSLPCARGFFARHDWYRSFRRELTQGEDEERLEGMKVFTYRFEADGEGLTAWIDRAARAVTAVETDDFLVGAIAGAPEPPRGLPTPMRWRLTNKRTDRALPISLIAGGAAGLTLDHRATLTLAPSVSTTLEASVAVEADAPEAPANTPAPAIRSLFVIDGHLVELATGLRPRPAVAVTIEPEAVTLAPGVARTVLLQLRSGLDREATATVSLAPASGLTADWTERSATLPPNGYAGLPVTLRAEAGGVYALPVTIALAHDGRSIPLPSAPLTVFVLPAGGVLGAVVDGGLRIENEAVRLAVERQGGRLTLHDKATGVVLGRVQGHPAPPSWPSEYHRGAFDLTLVRTVDGLLATASMASGEHPQFRLCRRVAVNAGPVIRVEHEFENLGATERTFSLHQGAHSDSNGARSTLTLPLAAGLTRGPGSDFPGESDLAFTKASAFAERWSAVETAGTTLGLVWGADVEEIERGQELTTRRYACAPRSRVRPEPLHLYVGDGGWPAVQRLSWRLAGVAPPQITAPAAPSEPLSARVEPSPVVVVGAAGGFDLLVEHRRSRPARGTAGLELPAGWAAEPAAIDVAGVTWDRPARVAVRLTATARPGAAAGRIALRTDERDADLDLALIRLGDGTPVEVRDGERSGQRVVTIANGRLEIDVTPDFGGTVSALRAGGMEHLASPFPTATTFGWMSPWHGGLTPILVLPGEDSFPGNLSEETFDAEPVAVADGRGVIWRGVRQRATPRHEALRGLTVEIDTLTVGGSLVVKHVVRLVNATPAARRAPNAGWAAFVQPDGDRSRTTFWGPSQQVKHSDRIVWFETGAWAAAQNPATGRTLALVSPRRRAGLSGWGSEGNHLAALTPLTVPAGGVAEVVGYLALADDLDEARHYAALADLA